jgi:oxygen-independent coproporphyrinogen III oxidase
LAGIYIHIPFCKQACNYCNFHFSTSLKLKQQFINALLQEISITTPYILNNKNEQDPGPALISTLYFGGGTPSILTAADLRLIVDALQKKFTFNSTIEITLEANPDDITDEKLFFWKAIGINRLSVGIQSFLNEELKWMNRAHTAEESLTCIDRIKNADFTNFSVDLIYGSPLLSDADWKKNVMLVIEKNIPHISCYALTVEPKTALEKMIARNKKQATDAEKQAQQFMLLMQWMEEAGYEHYEISNFAKPGLQSRHNSSYWSGEMYYGFGPSAHSFDGKTRKWNIASNALYISSLQKNMIPFEEERLTETQQLNEYIMTSLRTMQGLDLEWVRTRFGKNYSNNLQVTAHKYISSKKIAIENFRLILTKEGRLFADGIAAALFF